MSSQNVVAEVKGNSVNEEIAEIWRTGRELGLPDEEIHRVFVNSVLLERRKAKELDESDEIEEDDEDEEKSEPSSILVQGFRKITKVLFYSAVFVALSYIAISFHNPTRKFITRNIQDFIFPFMTNLRTMTLPVLANYPQLSQWYAEECLVDNPYFDQPNVDCSACSEEETPDPIRASGLKNFTDIYYNNGRSVIVTDAVPKSVSWTDLMQRINIHREEEHGYWKASSKKGRDKVELVDELMMGNFPDSDTHIEWKINRLQSLHTVRRVLPRPYFIPKDTEVGLQRLVFVDGPESDSYKLPLMEFANVLVAQSEGESSIILDPSQHCENICESVKVSLKTTEVLFFNWIFWRPVREGGDGISTVVMSSFY